MSAAKPLPTAGEHGPRLPAPVDAVLAAAGDVVAARGAVGVARERMLATPQGVQTLLDLLVGAASLRAAARRGLAARAPEPTAPDPASSAPADQTDTSDPTGQSGLPDRVAAALVGADQDQARRAAAVVAGWLQARGGAADAGRSTNRRAERLTAQQRAERRDQHRVDRLRAARDRAVHQAKLYQAEAAEARSEAAGLVDEVGVLRLRLTAAERRADAARDALADPLRLAESLACLISGQPAESPAETVRPDRLTAAALAAGLAEPVAREAAAWLPRLLRGLASPPPRVSVRAERALAVDVLGGGVGIGGSCVLARAGDTRVLVDAGSRASGADAASVAPPRLAEALSGRIDAIILTHAHNDHAGWAPAVLARQHDIPIYATEATGELVAPMWFDGARVLARKVESGEAWTGGPAPFRGVDAERALANLRPLPFGRVHRVGDIEIELFPAGHIVGAAGVVLRAGESRVVVSGDVSGVDQHSVGGIRIPDSARGADLLLLESTYAHQARGRPRSAVVEEFVQDVRAVVGAGGRVLVPAFALGRAQEIALILRERLPEVDVLVDGLARSICEVYERHRGPDGEPLRIFGGNVRQVERGRREQAMARLTAGVVITTSGMLSSGPAVGWAERVLPDPASALFVVGYQDEESPGGRLLELAERGGGEYPLPDGAHGVRRVRVAAAVRQHQLGAHANGDELAEIAADVKAGQVMLVHGEQDAQERFAKRLALRGQATVSARRLWTPPC